MSFYWSFALSFFLIKKIGWTKMYWTCVKSNIQRWSFCYSPNHIVQFQKRSEYNDLFEIWFKLQYILGLFKNDSPNFHTWFSKDCSKLVFDILFQKRRRQFFFHVFFLTTCENHYPAWCNVADAIFESSDIDLVSVFWDNNVSKSFN